MLRLFFVAVLTSGCRTIPLQETPRDLGPTDQAALPLDFSGWDLDPPSLAPSWSMHGGNSRATSLSAHLGPTGGRDRWAVGGVARLPLVGPDGTVYVGLSARRPDGSVRWGPLAQGAVSTALDGAGTIYGVELLEWSEQGADWKLWSFDAATGATRWNVAFHDGSWLAPLRIGDDRTVYVATNKSVRAIAPDGQERWQIPVGVTSGFVLGRDGALVGDFWGGLSSRDAATGAERWHVESQGYNYAAAAPVIGAGGTIYWLVQFPLEPSNLLAIAPDDGHRLWGTSLPDKTFTLENDPAIGPDGTIYVNGSGTYWAIAPDGSLRWMKRGVSFVNPPVIGADGTQYVSGWFGSNYLDRADAALYAIAPDGRLLWALASPGRALQWDQAALDTGVLYFTLSDDQGQAALHAIGP